MSKQYYDLFAYHAAQRLTAFNFFLVSLSFFSTAYATLITRSGETGKSYYAVASALAFAAYLLIIAFGRLDKRNEQIIRVNEQPLKRIQAEFRRGLGEGDDEVWETFRQAEKAYRFRTYSSILPFIYCLAAAASAGGSVFGITGPGPELHIGWAMLWAALILFSSLAICFPLSKLKDRNEEEISAASTQSI